MTFVIMYDACSSLIMWGRSILWLPRGAVERRDVLPVAEKGFVLAACGVVKFRYVFEIGPTRS